MPHSSATWSLAHGHASLSKAECRLFAALSRLRAVLAQTRGIPPQTRGIPPQTCGIPPLLFAISMRTCGVLPPTWRGFGVECGISFFTHLKPPLRGRKTTRLCRTLQASDDRSQITLAFSYVMPPLKSVAAHDAPHSKAAVIIVKPLSLAEAEQELQKCGTKNRRLCFVNWLPSSFCSCLSPPH